MVVRKNLLLVKRKHLGGLLLLAFISIICVAFSMTGADDFHFAKREVILRRIGHEVLLQSGDSTSRVLPIKKISANEYQISFENALTFQPDSLVAISKRSLAMDPLASDYIVNVLYCRDSRIAYGYAVSGNKKDDIIACIGRKQPKACYLINIKFQSADSSTARNGYLLGGLAVLAVLGYLFFKPAKPQRVVPENEPALPEEHAPELQHPSPDMLSLGSMLFDVNARKLLIDGTTIELTKTETRVLRIFALSPNEVIERSRLQKEIWEDEGVIVSRSLDMFISKLRKKLEPDPTIKIAVVRGTGYKLEINS